MRVRVRAVQGVGEAGRGARGAGLGDELRPMWDVRLHRPEPPNPPLTHHATPPTPPTWNMLALVGRRVGSGQSSVIIRMFSCLNPNCKRCTMNQKARRVSSSECAPARTQTAHLKMKLKLKHKRVARWGAGRCRARGVGPRHRGRGLRAVGPKTKGCPPSGQEYRKRMRAPPCFSKGIPCTWRR